jgi:exonuclease III
VLLNWNVRGLNNPSRRQVVRDLIQERSCTVVCLQETKILNMSDAIVAETLGQCFISNYATLPAEGTRGAILLACSQDEFSLANVQIKQHSVTATIRKRRDNTSWTITVVYGPEGETAKLEFLQEIRLIKQTADPEWLILGDFNLICKINDKSNGRVNLRLLSSFQWILDEPELKELHLHGRRFTWTSASCNPTMTKIDHVFSSREWELKQPHCHLQALRSSVYDHCPMVLSCGPFHRRYTGFRFQSWWTHATGFLEVVQKCWQVPVNSNNKARVLHVKLARLAKALKRWSKERLALIKQESMDASSTVLHLDQQQDTRQLTDEEIQQRKVAKGKILGLAAIRKLKMRQCSRLTWIRAGDANTKLFHLRASARRRKNYIPVLHHHGATCTTHESKANTLHSYYSDQLGTATLRECTLAWSRLQPQRYDLAELDNMVTEEEIHMAITQMPAEKAPGPDGYIGTF